LFATAKETIDRISGVLVEDEQTLTPQEKELLANLLQAANQQAGEGRNVLTDTIIRAVGETVAQRAYNMLGQSIAQRLAAEPLSNLQEIRRTALAERLHMPPKPPGPIPPFPGPPGPGKALVMPPQPPSPFPPGPHAAARPSADKFSPRFLQAEILPATCVVLDEFLSTSELEGLYQYALAHENDFQVSEVIAPGASSEIDFDHRRSRVLMELGRFQNLLEGKLLAALPRVLPRLNCPPFAKSHTEMQITASGDGDFFRCHSDNAYGEISSRQVTFVYFFHREPKAFEGGELKLYDSQWQDNTYVAMESSRAVVPEQNRMVLFISSLMHELAPVRCLSGRFADSRFTVNGWMHRERL